MTDFDFDCVPSLEQISPFIDRVTRVYVALKRKARAEKFCVDFYALDDADGDGELIDVVDFNIKPNVTADMVMRDLSRIKRGYGILWISFEVD